MTGNKELNGCPFCGQTDDGNGALSVLKNNNNGKRLVFCENCEANGPRKTTAEEAIAAWNRRAVCAEQK